MKTIKRILKLFITITLIAALMAGYVTYGERNLLTAKKIDVQSENNRQKSVKIVQFSDTHLGEFYSLKQFERAVHKINEQNPDIVVFTGDLLDIASQYDDREGAVRVLDKIEAALGKYAVFGNRDYGGGGVRFYESLMEEAGFQVLVDEKARIELEEKTLVLYGSDDHLLGSPDTEKLMEGIDKNDYNILLSHEPDAMEHYKEYPIDLAITGHSHGGQVRIPFYGPLIKTNMCDLFFKGNYELDNNRKTELFVSSGLGNTKVPYRFLNVPEVVVFQIYYQ